MKLLSVIVPSYNEEENVFDFYAELMKNEAFFKQRELDVEIIYVDDGSKDKTVEKVKELAGKDKRVHLVSFSRNFGKEAAIYAGLAKGERGLCGVDGLRSAGSAFPVAGDVPQYGRGI